MSLELATRLTEILLALAFIQQSLEHLHRPKQALFILRIILCVLLITGWQAPYICLALFINATFILRRFHGPYNGGSDRMGLLILACLCFAHALPSLQEYIFGYLALQVILSYFIPGCVKIINPQWRNGQALQDLFRFSAYPASEALRVWADRPRILFLMSWVIMLFELLFPLTLIKQPLLVIGLIMAMSFHLANTYLFGLNRFFWVWLAAYPSLTWFQERFIIYPF